MSFFKLSSRCSYIYNIINPAWLIAVEKIRDASFLAVFPPGIFEWEGEGGEYKRGEDIGGSPPQK